MCLKTGGTHSAVRMSRANTKWLTTCYINTEWHMPSQNG